jgi:hypothetical protein
MPVSGPWIDNAKLRALFNAGLTYDEIAEQNEHITGWRPTRSGVAKKFERLGYPARHASHLDLIPWRKSAGGTGIAKKHDHDRMIYMLAAESKKRQGIPLTDSDRILVGLLHDLLFGRGRFLVVGYDTKIGFYLSDRTDDDLDVIRAPDKAGVSESESG